MESKKKPMDGGRNDVTMSQMDSNRYKTVKEHLDIVKKHTESPSSSSPASDGLVIDKLDYGVLDVPPVYMCILLGFQVGNNYTRADCIRSTAFADAFIE